MLVNAGGVDDVRVFLPEMGLCGNLAVPVSYERREVSERRRFSFVPSLRIFKICDFDFPSVAFSMRNCAIICHGKSKEAL